MPFPETHTEPTDFSAETRRHNLVRLGQETFDILVIGGGITGAGLARHAARCGYKVALVEKGDLAGGTSSKSSKLVHGGLRYLAALDLGLVFRACHGRHTLLHLAPHLVWPLPFVLPIYRDSPRPLWQIRAAMWLYDALATYRNIQSHQMWPAPQALAREPLLSPHGLVGAACYYDCGTDDARLTLVTLLDAHRAGAVIANYTEVTGLLQARGRIVGAQVCDQQGDAETEIRAHVVVSAVGPWTDGLLGLTGIPSQPWLRLTKGVHIVVPRQRAPTQAAISFNSPRDGRFLFLIPWGAHTLIGTTDTDHEGSPDKVFATSEDVAYILEAAQQAFPSARLSEGDVVSTYAGLRPLIREDGTSSYQNSRQYHIREVMPGLTAIAGGKLTTYCAMARKVMNEVARILAREHGIHPRDFKNGTQAPLPGGDVGDWASYQAQQRVAIVNGTGLQDEVARHLVATYGTEVPRMLRLLEEEPALAGQITPDLPVVKAQAVHAVRHEMALTLEDVLERRTHVLTLAADQGLGAAEPVADLMAAYLGWTPEERTAQTARYRHQVALSRRWRPVPQ
jgi:glycerol-3-phosphate dehydrogenase